MSMLEDNIGKYMENNRDEYTLTLHLIIILLLFNIIIILLLLFFILLLFIFISNYFYIAY